MVRRWQHAGQTAVKADIVFISTVISDQPLQMTNGDRSSSFGVMPLHISTLSNFGIKIAFADVNSLVRTQHFQTEPHGPHTDWLGCKGLSWGQHA
jgi:hypothetical protein